MNPRRFALALAFWLLAIPAGPAAALGSAAAAPSAQPGAASGVAPTLDQQVGDRLQKEVQAQGIVGISVALVRDGRIAHVGHFGWEDRERKVPASDATMYRWASISKPLTAIAAMQLWEDGRLDLDADVRTLVPEFPEPRPACVITTRQLLCHQGGIVHYTNGVVVRTPRPDLAGRYTDAVDAIDTFKASPLVAEPGTKHAYTTHGYILAGAAVQRAGEQPYAAQVIDRIAQPLGMTTLRPDYQWEQIPHRAVGYRPALLAAVRGEKVVSTDTDVSWKLAGGGWLSNVNDLAFLAVGLLDGRLVEPTTRDLMWTPQTTADGKQTSYGLGFNVGRFRDHTLVSHSGSQEKARTLLLMLPEQNAAVALMCNTEGTNLGPLGRDLLGLLVDAPAAGAAGESPAAALPTSP